jgi:hypothetical protein
MDTPLYIPADVALWLFIESGGDVESADAAYLRSLGSDLVLIAEDVPSASEVPAHE